MSSKIFAIAISALLVLPVDAAVGSAGRSSAPELWPLADFCARAQQLIGSTSYIANNVIHDDLQAFTLSKPKVRPLETEQHHWFDDAAKKNLKMISCKMKTSDHLRSEYGDSASAGEGSCNAVNQHSLDAVLAGLKRQRGKLRFEAGRNIVFEPEERTNIGPEWLKQHEVAWQDDTGRLHIQSRAMRNDWLDPRYLKAPPQFRGTRYCHLIAPDYLRRLLTGEVAAPRSRGEPVSPAQMPAIP